LAVAAVGYSRATPWLPSEVTAQLGVTEGGAHIVWAKCQQGTAAVEQEGFLSISLLLVTHSPHSCTVETQGQEKSYCRWEVPKCFVLCA